MPNNFYWTTGREFACPVGGYHGPFGSEGDARADAMAKGFLASEHDASKLCIGRLCEKCTRPAIECECD